MYKLLRPLLFRMDAERAHDVSLRAAGLVQSINPSLVEPLYEYEDERLKQRLWGEVFSSPVGLAAGADKNARLLPFWEAVGFGFVEVGSVTARPSDGNPKPRAFRLEEDEALVNRMGLNNDGAEAVAGRLEKAHRTCSLPIGVNIAKTHDPDVMGEAAIEDFRESFRHVVPHADYVALNVSCPNTREGKTFEDPEALDVLLETIFAAQTSHPGVKTPVLIKLSPPLSDRIVFDTQLEDLIAVAQAHGVDGYIATNTASDRDGLQTPDVTLKRIGEGGLSGVPLAGRSTRLVRYLYTATGGDVPIIGVGGVQDADSAYEKICAGASLVQVYTALIYEGPGLVRQIKEGLVDHLRSDGFANVANAVGSAV
jgi:dihydroorotate dehydrogenase